jgi:hypothetical protein
VPPSKLETQAVTSHAPKRPKHEQSPAHLAALESRALLLGRLEDEEAWDLADPLRKCGDEIPMICLACGMTHVFHRRCNRKWCPACQRALAARASLRYTGIVASMQWPLFVTLTVKNWPDDKVDFVRHMRRSFGKLRRLRWWCARVKGGVAGIEVTERGKGWHPHLHTVIDCKWLGVTTHAPPRGCDSREFTRRCQTSAKEVNQQWELCTGLRSGIKTKRASAQGNGKDKPISTEILKYSVKGSDLLKSKEPIASVLRMLDGTRLITSFGSCYGHLRDFDLPKEKAECPECEQRGGWMPRAELEYHRKQIRRR